MSPLSDSMTPNNTGNHVVFEEEEDPLDDLLRAADLEDPSSSTPVTADAPPKGTNENQRPALPRKIHSTRTVRNRIPKYWNATLPLRGESKEESEAAARRAKFRLLKDKSYIFEIQRRNRDLHPGEHIPIKELSTPSKATITGDLFWAPVCKVPDCDIHVYGASGQLCLAAAAQEMLERKLEAIHEHIEEETESWRLPAMIEERDRLHKQERERGREVTRLLAIWSEDMSYEDGD